MLPRKTDFGLSGVTVRRRGLNVLTIAVHEHDRNIRNAVTVNIE
jgi:hypothetical protein